MTKAIYSAQAHVTGGRQGRGRTSDGRLDVDLRMPKELGGDGEGVNPEQLFAVGYAACFGSVLGLLGQRDGVRTDDATIDATVSLIPAGGGTFKLGAELDVTLPSVEDGGRAAELVRAAHQVCPYSSATRGNVDVAFTVNGTPL
ncbi:organic hydroperoxide resistance protein [Spirillospora sp. CA-253888]